MKRTRKLKDYKSPLITFTESAKPYFLPVSIEEKEIDIQNVKIADEDFVEITDLKINNRGKNVVVFYKTIYKNITPMEALLAKPLPSEVQRRAYFSLTDKGWIVIEKADFELMK